MEKIKFMGLGGLQENGKNMYFVEYKGEGLIVDAGSTSYMQKGIGIDIVLPDIEFFKSKKILGIFISHGHIDQVGALSKLLKTYPEMVVYASCYTIEFLKLTIKGKRNFVSLKYDDVIKLGNFTIEPFCLSHAIFGNYGYVINTPVGALAYASDYNFNQAVSANDRTDIAKIIELQKKYQIKALLTESLSAENVGVAAHEQNKVAKFANYILQSDKRIFVTLYSSNVTGINNILRICEQANRKICIIGRDLLNYVNISRKLDYIRHIPGQFIKIADLDKYPANEVLIIVSGQYEEPFRQLALMARNQAQVNILATDLVIIASKPYDQIEGYAQGIYDIVARTECQIIEQKVNVASHAHEEDIKMMINLFQPQFIIPIKGEYRKQIQVEQIAKNIGYDESQVVILANGDSAEISDSTALVTERIKLSNILWDQENNENPISQVVINDRMLLSSDGYVIVVLLRDGKTHKMTQKPRIVSGGNSNFNDNDAIMLALTKMVTDVVNSSETIDKTIQNKIRNKISRYLQNSINKKPVILHAVIDI